MQIFVAACLLIVLGTMLFIDYVKYFIGADYRVGLQVVPILLVANVCIGIYYNLTIWYKLTNQTMMGTYITLGGAAVTLAMNFILIPIIGFMGSAWATLACYFLMMCASYFLGQKYFPVNYPLRKIFTQTALALGIYAASQVFTKSVFFQFGIFEAHSIPGTISLAVLFVAAIFLFWKMNKRELHL
jgi:O-antigen/teichoic acid export membrane protein